MSLYQQQQHQDHQIDELTQSNDLSVITSQISSDEIVMNSDIINAEQIINQSRELERKETFQVDIWSIVKRSAINLILPFINGMMLGFGEILAHEIGFHYRWRGARVEPVQRIEKRRIEESKYL